MIARVDSVFVLVDVLLLSRLCGRVALCVYYLCAKSRMGARSNT